MGVWGCSRGPKGNIHFDWVLWVWGSGVCVWDGGLGVGAEEGGDVGVGVCGMRECVEGGVLGWVCVE